jgi:hypothetical protein
MTVNTSESLIIARSTRLRARVWALHYESGSWFTRQLSREWKAEGIRGIGLACADLALELQHVAGAWECYSEARSIAASCSY